MRTLKVLALLLAYPEENILAAADEMLLVFEEEALLPGHCVAGLRMLLAARAKGGIYEAQARYGALFDSQPSASLYLFQHLYGDSRERGPALVELIELYQEHGLEMSVRELPDYLPLFIEFASQLPESEARSLLGDTTHVFEVLRQRLTDWHSPYAAVFSALVALSSRPPDKNEMDKLTAQKVRTPGDMAAIDEDWEDKPVSFSVGSAHESVDATGGPSQPQVMKFYPKGTEGGATCKT